MSKSEMKHTPGPWVFSLDCEGDAPRLISENNALVCSFGGGENYDQYSGEPPNDADMFLIAAAPELLEALKVLRVSIPSKYKALRDIAERAIAKATGSAQ